MDQKKASVYFIWPATFIIIPPNIVIFGFDKYPNFGLKTIRNL